MRNSPQRNGSILITALWVVALLSVLALSVGGSVRLRIREAEWQSRDIEARSLLDQLATAAVARAKQDSEPEADHLGEPWGRARQWNSDALARGGDAGNPKSRPFTAQIRVFDEQGKVNINYAPEAVIDEVLREAGIEADRSAILAAIVDWRDEDTQGQWEASAYSGTDIAYVPTNGNLRHLEELALVRGITTGMFIGEDTNRNGILDPSEDDGDVFPPYDNEDGALQPGLTDLFTVYGDGRVNINTASLAILRSLFRVVLPSGEADSFARKIAEHRSGPDGELGTDDDRPYLENTDLESALDEHYGALLNAGIEFGLETEAIRYVVDVTYESPHYRREAEFVVLREDDALRLAEFRSDL